MLMLSDAFEWAAMRSGRCPQGHCRVTRSVARPGDLECVYTVHHTTDGVVRTMVVAVTLLPTDRGDRRFDRMAEVLDREIGAAFPLHHAEAGLQTALPTGSGRGCTMPMQRLADWDATFRVLLGQGKTVHEIAAFMGLAPEWVARAAGRALSSNAGPLRESRRCQSCSTPLEVGAYCETCGRARHRHAAAMTMTLYRAFPDLPFPAVRALGRAHWTPDDVRAATDGEILTVRGVGPSALAALRALVPTPMPAVVPSWVGEGVYDA